MGPLTPTVLMLMLAPLSRWVWAGRSDRLHLAAGYAACGALAALLERVPVEAALLGAVALSTELLAWIDRRWPVDCVYCRFFRAAIAVSSAAAVVVVTLVR